MIALQRSKSLVILRRMVRQRATRLVLPLALAVLSTASAYAQTKMACDLVTKADAEAILGVTFQPPRPYAPFRSLLGNRDFAYGQMGEGCAFTNYSPTQPPAKGKELGGLAGCRITVTPYTHSLESAGLIATRPTSTDEPEARDIACT
jgi:hypothetical protein